MKITIDESLLRQIFAEESKKLCGIIMKRYEIIDDKETLKKEIKELIYESFRNVRDVILTCGREPLNLTNENLKSKE